jgi:hypothetical protein
MPTGKFAVTRFTLTSRTLRVHAPLEWTDEQAQALLGPIAEAIDAAADALRTRLLEIHPDLSVTSYG